MSGNSKFKIRRWMLRLAVGLLLSEHAMADETNVVRAREYFRAGAQAYSVGEYGAAIQAFEQAYNVAPRPAVLFSIAQAERRQFFFTHDTEHLRRAIEMYRKYLNDEPQPARKTDAVQALSELEPMLASAANSAKAAIAPTSTSPPSPAPTPESTTQPTRVMISSPVRNVTIALDGQFAGRSPVVREVNPGEHVVHVSAPGHLSTERRIIAVSGELVTMDVALAEQPASLEVIAPRDAQLSIDGRVQGRCPFPKPIELAAGPHLVTVSKDGFVGIAREERLQAGKTTVFRVSLQRSRQRTTAMFMVGASASALTAGGVFAYFSYKQEQAAQSFLDSRGRRELSADDRDLYNKTRLDRDRLRGAAWVSVGVGLGLGVTSALMWLYDGGTIKTIQNQEKPPNQAQHQPTRYFAQPLLGPGFAGFGLQGNF